MCGYLAAMNRAFDFANKPIIFVDLSLNGKDHQAH
jgi:hypothetical protein